MAQGRFAPIYTEIRQQLRREVDRVLYWVLDAVAEHCDAYGWCYPGNRALADATGFAESTVQKALDELEARGWIKQVYTINPRRRRPERDIVISPDVIYIREELEQDAFVKWESAWSQASLSNVVQPENQSQYPEIENQSQNQSAALNAERTQDGNLSHDNDESANNESAQQRNAPQHAMQPAQRAKNHNAPALPQEKPSVPRQNASSVRKLVKFDSALPSENAEKLAVELAQGYGTRLVQARQIVATYDVDQVMQARAYVDAQRRKRKVLKPFGLLTWWLKQSNQTTQSETTDTVTDTEPPRGNAAMLRQMIGGAQ